MDGAGDEGPAHKEVQFFWTRDHLHKGRLATLVTTRSSGASYLNRVELQNGYLGRGHSSLFIPSTLCGSPTENGEINNDIFRKNLDTAIDTYISYVDKSPCGNTVINLYKGAENPDIRESTYREKLKIFLKGSRQSKSKLKNDFPSLYEEFATIWQIRFNHMLDGFPPHHIFYLLACFESSCPHPICQNNVGSSRKEFRWFTNGPLLTQIPLPVRDPERPWGGSCTTCPSDCSGHYLMPEASLQPGKIPCKPPAQVISEAFRFSISSQTPVDMDTLAKEVLLPRHEVQFWIDYLHTVPENRKHGSKKAAATKRKKSAETSSNDLYGRGICHEVYQDGTEVEENWIGCDKCPKLVSLDLCWNLH